MELGVVIGKEARYLTSPEAAHSHIAGYCLTHDVSERAFQLERGGQWTKGKSCDTFNPLGPWLATPEEISNVDALPMQLWVNGELRQKGTTAKMIFNVPFLVHYLSQFMTLEPGGPDFNRNATRRRSRYEATQISESRGRCRA